MAKASRHHTLRHAPGVRVRDQHSDHGRITVWTLPDGRTYQVTRAKDIILTVDEGCQRSNWPADDPGWTASPVTDRPARAQAAMT